MATHNNEELMDFSDEETALVKVIETADNALNSYNCERILSSFQSPLPPSTSVVRVINKPGTVLSNTRETFSPNQNKLLQSLNSVSLHTTNPSFDSFAHVTVPNSKTQLQMYSQNTTVSTFRPSTIYNLESLSTKSSLNSNSGLGIYSGDNAKRISQSLLDNCTVSPSSHSTIKLSERITDDYSLHGPISVASQWSSKNPTLEMPVPRTQSISTSGPGFHAYPTIPARNITHPSRDSLGYNTIIQSQTLPAPSLISTARRGFQVQPPIPTGNITHQIYDFKNNTTAHGQIPNGQSPVPQMNPSSGLFEHAPNHVTGLNRLPGNNSNTGIFHQTFVDRSSPSFQHVPTNYQQTRALQEIPPNSYQLKTFRRTRRGTRGGYFKQLQKSHYAMASFIHSLAMTGESSASTGRGGRGRGAQGQGRDILPNFPHETQF